MSYEAWSAEIEYSPGVWTDVTSRVDGSFTIQDGDTPESSSDTGGFMLPLANHDQAFTPGNQLSALALRAGLRVRIRETVNGQLFERGFGYTAYPEIDAWTQSTAEAPRAQLLTLPVIDRAAWIAQGRSMISTLGEHILHHGGTALVAYWPMGETDGPAVNPARGAPWTLRQTKLYNGFANAQPGLATITYGSPGIAPADDLGSISFSPSLSTDPITDYVTSLALDGKRSATFTLGAGQALTVVCWTRPSEIASDTFQSSLPISLGSSTSASVSASVGMIAGSVFAGAGNAGAWGGNIAGAPVPMDQAIPVAVRVSFDPAVLELWVRGEVYAGSLSVSSADPATYDRITIAERYPGAINHAQVYVGDPGDWTHDDFLVQHQMGLLGMERQSTGDRIRTVLQYAGVDASELSRVDDGASLMQVGRLAGRNPMDVIAEAVATEQGEFYIDGAGQPVFADRIRLYNV